MATGAPEVFAELSVDGVYYAHISLDDRKWRVGATDAEWLDRFILYAGDAEALAGQGIWVAPYNTEQHSLERPGLMCCGLGSVWPGMGQELYADFPAAREAMEEIAGLADWDVLGLMDEKDLTIISRSRWQIPYLFMLEYSQWRQFSAMGLKPGLVCGHSLGELIALCIAGIYDLASAWYLLETRAMHMSELEARDNMAGGMLAVPAEYADIRAVLKQWPELRISNRNTHKQFILGGPRNILLEARRSLRHKRIPAVMLNMNLAFHNPAMRILRSLSYRRLTALRMVPASIPILSCVDAREYPSESNAICRRITDLDENTVDWVNLMEEVKARYDINAFLELGPQETLCTISSELVPEWDFIPSDRKGHEADAMRAACARLFAKGYFTLEDLSSYARHYASSNYKSYHPVPQVENTLELIQNIPEKDRNIIIGLLAEVSMTRAEDIRPDTDLRHDLGLRSVNFPYLLLEAEQRLGKQADLEKLFQLNTTAELMLFLTGVDTAVHTSSVSDTVREEYRMDRRPLVRFRLNSEGTIDPVKAPPAPDKADKSPVYGYFFDSRVNPRLFDELAKNGHSITLSGAKEQLKDSSSVWDSAIRQFGSPTLAGLNSFLESVNEDAIIVVFLPPYGSDENLAQDIISQVGGQDRGSARWRKTIFIRRFSPDEENAARAWLSGHGNQTMVAWLDNANSQGGDSVSASHLLVLEAASNEQVVIWKKAPFDVTMHGASRQCYDVFYPECNESGANFEALCQFSSSPYLQDHGSHARFTPLVHNNPPCLFLDAAFLPMGMRWEMLHEAATILEPSLISIGFADWRILRMIALPEGITRECRVVANNRLSLVQEGVPATMCNMISQIAALTGTGRKNGSWLGLDEITMIMARENPPIRSLWKGPSSLSSPWSQEYLDQFHDLLGFGDKWRFIRRIRRAQWPDGAKGISCELDLGRITDNQYNDFSCIMDAIFEASHIALLAGDSSVLSSGEMAELLLPWRLSSIGFGRFDAALISRADRLEMCTTWQNDSLTRFDCQLFTESGDVILNINNLEYERIQAHTSAQAPVPEVS